MSILIGLAALAQATAPTPEPAAPPAKPKLICRYEDDTGSRLRQRHCYTAEVWLAKERQRQDSGQLMRSHASSTTDNSI